tara:strand:- start:90327 stop:91325 length:999 start_codon:yes stop_codon:yes gene_type:complete
MLVVHQVPKPNAPKRKWPALIPWILEEKLLQKPEDLHFVIAGKNQDRLSILVTAKSQMQEWQQQAAASGIKNYVLIPDFFALPWQAGTISIGHRADQILVRYGEFDGYSAAPEYAWHMLDNLLKNSNAQTKLSLSLASEDLPQRFQDRVAISNQNMDWNNAGYPMNADLLQGEFSLTTGSGSYLPWLSTAALLVLSIALGLLTLNLENARLENEIASLREANRTAFYSLFPGLSIRSGDIRATVERFISNRFRQRESLQSDAMLALTTIDNAMSACNCDLQSLQWNSAGLQLSLPLSAADSIEQWHFDGYSKQVRAEADTGLLLTLFKEGQQ